jgi:lipopolysaccharide/colanic/teichoic acid biosynthesis glycosyltransferase
MDRPWLVDDPTVFPLSATRSAPWEPRRLSLPVNLRRTVRRLASAEAHEPVLDHMGPAREMALALRHALAAATAAVTLVLLSPLLALVALAVKLQDGGPVLFRQTRCGLRGRRFTMLKFRSMHVDAHRQKASLMHLNEATGPSFKIADDPRITPLGALLRKFSLDELPQLFNVVRGDMAMVGPRPPLPEEVAEYDEDYLRRLDIKPGLTGLWQVSGRSDLEFPEWVRLDVRYIDEWSPWLDAQILLRTPHAVLSGRGAR